MVDTTMLNLSQGKDIVGYYSNAMRGVSIIRSVLVAICAVFLPRMSYYFTNQRYDDFKKLVNRGLLILVYLSIPTAVGSIMLAEPLIPLLFGESFSPAIVTMQILSISIISVAISNFLGTQVFVTLGKEKQLLISTVIGAIANIILNSFLIRLYQQNGAAVASVITEILVTVYQVVVIYKSDLLSIKWTDILKMIAANIPMALMIVLIKNMPIPSLLQVALSVAIGATIYFAMTYVLKLEASREMVDYLKKFLGRKRKS